MSNQEMLERVRKTYDYLGDVLLEVNKIKESVEKTLSSLAILESDIMSLRDQDKEAL